MPSTIKLMRVFGIGLLLQSMLVQASNDLASTAQVPSADSQPATVEKPRKVKALSPELAAAKARVSEQVDGFNFLRLHSWRAIDDRHLIVEVNMRQNFLLTLRQPCIDLPFQHAIALTSMGKRVQAGFESVVVDDKHTRLSQRCRIDKIERLQARQPKTPA